MAQGLETQTGTLVRHTLDNISVFKPNHPIITEYSLHVIECPEITSQSLSYRVPKRYHV